MSRDNDFSATVTEEATQRQDNMCACCGVGLYQDDVVPNAHHAIPNQTFSGKDSFASSVDNCVVVCDDCHPEVHSDNYVNGPVYAPAEFEYSHGTDTVAHDTWVDTVDAKWEEVRENLATQQLPPAEPVVAAQPETTANTLVSSGISTSLGGDNDGF